MSKKIFALLLIAALTLATVALSETGSVSQETIDRFSDTWVTNGFSAEIWYENDAFGCDMALNDDSFCEYRNCVYDADSDTLICRDGVRFYATYDEESADYNHEIIATDLTAVFTEADNLLTCEDSEGLLAGVVFLHLYDAEELDEADSNLIGDWETSDGMAAMTIEKNPNDEGWDLEIVSAESHGASVFRTTIRYDVQLHCFSYSEGRFWDAPISDSEETPELGEPKIAGTIGTFTLMNDEEGLQLTWIDDQDPENEVAFRKVLG